MRAVTVAVAAIALCALASQPVTAERSGLFAFHSIEFTFATGEIWDTTRSGNNGRFDAGFSLTYENDEGETVRSVIDMYASNTNGGTQSPRNRNRSPYSVGAAVSVSGGGDILDFRWFGQVQTLTGNATKPPVVDFPTNPAPTLSYTESVFVEFGDFESEGEATWTSSKDDGDIYVILAFNISADTCDYSAANGYYTCSSVTPFNVPYPSMPLSNEGNEPLGLEVRFTFSCTQNSDCGSYATCNAGSCTCDDTFVSAKEDGYNCEPTMCLEDLHCTGDHEVCASSTVGNFDCACETGYEMDNMDNCVDVDECTDTPDICGSNAMCMNVDGSYTCTCETGYEMDNMDNCVDVDECTDTPDICGSNAMCMNVEGSYTCTCETGYEMDNMDNCVDADECTDTPAICGSNAMCMNVEGSYTCTCETGYEMDDMGVCIEAFPSIMLLGANPLYLQAGVDVYTELGAHATNSNDSLIHYTVTGADTVVAAVAARALGSYNISYTARDANNIVVTKDRTVVIHDTLPPTLRTLTPVIEVTLPFSDDDLNTLYGNTGSLFLAADTGSPIAGFTVDTPRPQLEAMLNDLDATSDITVGVTVSDAAGNPARADIVVRAVDVEAPVLVFVDGLGTQDVEADVSGDGAGVVDAVGLSATDNVAIGAVMASRGAIDVASPGVETVSYAATDVSGNPSQALLRRFFVRDTVSPMLSFAGGRSDGVVVDVDAGEAVPLFLEPSAVGVSDAAGDASARATLSRTPAALDLSTGLGDRTELVVFTASDASGNVGRLSSLLVVRDRPAVVGAVPRDFSLSDVSTGEFGAQPAVLPGAGEGASVVCGGGVLYSEVAFVPGQHVCVATSGRGFFAQVAQVVSHTTLYPSRGNVVVVRVSPSSSGSSSGGGRRRRSAALDEARVSLEAALSGGDHRGLVVGASGAPVRVGVVCYVLRVAEVSSVAGAFDCDVACVSPEYGVATEVVLALNLGASPSMSFEVAGSSSSGSDSTGVIVLVILIVVGLICAVAIVLLWKRRVRDRSHASTSKANMSTHPNPTYQNELGMPVHPAHPRSATNTHRRSLPLRPQPVSEYEEVSEIVVDAPPAVPQRKPSSVHNSSSQAVRHPTLRAPTSLYAEVSSELPAQQDSTTTGLAQPLPPPPRTSDSSVPAVQDSNSTETGRKPTVAAKPARAPVPKPRQKRTQTQWAPLPENQGSLEQAPRLTIREPSSVYAQVESDSPSTEGSKPLPYHRGAISRVQAEALLANSERGTFLVRDKWEGNFAISCAAEQGSSCVHHNIVLEENGFQLNGKAIAAPAAKDVASVVSYLQAHSDLLVIPLGLPLESSSNI